MLFANAIRGQVKEENPDMDPKEVMKEIGVRYKALGDEEMNKWKGKAAAAKETYKKELAEYEKTKPKEESKKPAKKVDSKKKKKKPEPESSEADSDDSSEASESEDDSDDSDSD